MGEIYLNVRTGEIKEQTRRIRIKGKEWQYLGHIDHRYSPHGWSFVSAYCKKCGRYHAYGWIRYAGKAVEENMKLFGYLMKKWDDCEAVYKVLGYHEYLHHTKRELFLDFIFQKLKGKNPTAEDISKLIEEFENFVKQVKEEEKERKKLKKQLERKKAKEMAEILKKTGAKVTVRGSYIYLNGKKIKVNLSAKEGG